VSGFQVRGKPTQNSQWHIGRNPTEVIGDMK
jgi:hypothetical protein